MNTQFSIAEFGSELHQKSIFLRNDILRKPLGLQFTDIELANEINQHHLVMLLNSEVCGVTLLVPISISLVKLRQFAVAESLQGKGYGRKLVAFAEEFAKQEGFQRIELHARETARGFYASCGYKTIGSSFLEIGIPHHKMTKTL